MNRRREQLDALEKEWPLLREEQRESLVRGYLRSVRFNLREVRPDRAVEDVVGIWRVFQIDPDLAIERIIHQRRAEVAGRMRGLGR